MIKSKDIWIEMRVIKIKSQSTGGLSNIFVLGQFSNQILWCGEFSQLHVSSIGIQLLRFHESGNWGNQAFSRSSSRPIRFDKAEKSESIGHFSKFVTIGIRLVGNRNQRAIYRDLLNFRKYYWEKKQLEFDSDIS